MFLLLKTLLQSLYIKPSAHVYDRVSNHIIAMPWHIDYNMHVNNSVYLKYLEGARWKHSLQTGIFRNYMDNKFGFIVAAIEIGYFREISLFQKLSVKTQIVGADEKYFYLSQSIVDKNGKLYTNAMIKAVIVHKGKSKPAAEAFAQMGLPELPAPLPEHFQTWRTLSKEKRVFTDAQS